MKNNQNPSKPTYHYPDLHSHMPYTHMPYTSPSQPHQSYGLRPIRPIQNHPTSYQPYPPTHQTHNIHSPYGINDSSHNKVSHKEPVPPVITQKIVPISQPKHEHRDFKESRYSKRGQEPKKPKVDYEKIFQKCPKVEPSQPAKSDQQEKKIISDPNDFIRAGLPNLGNTCYMNSLLQCMFHIPNFQVQLFGKPQVACKPISLRMSNLLLQSLSGKPVQRRDVIDLKVYIDQKLPQFKGTKQQDAQQFFQAIKGYIHRQLNEATQKIKLCNEIKVHEPIQEQIQRYTEIRAKVHDSLISRLFEGILLNSISCQCGEQMQNVEVFDELCLHLKGEQTINVPQLLTDYFKPEEIQQMRCQKCGQVKSVKKFSQVKKFPQVLVLHLKRFAFQNSASKKIETEVEAGLELALFEEQYKLIGLILHKGNLVNGHYTAWCLNPQNERWYEYNDSKVQSKEIEDYPKNAWYICFYQKGGSSK